MPPLWSTVSGFGDKTKRGKKVNNVTLEQPYPVKPAGLRAAAAESCGHALVSMRAGFEHALKGSASLQYLVRGILLCAYIVAIVILALLTFGWVTCGRIYQLSSRTNGKSRPKPEGQFYG